MSTRAGSFLVGLVGEGVLPSLTPPMHEREGDRQGLRYLYRPLDLLETGRSAAEIGELLSWARDLGFNGLNITHPCKQLVLPHLDEVSEDARRLAAVNTVVIQDGRFVGHNTDFSGFARALADGLPGASLERVVQLGAGGAGSAVAYALLTAGVGVLDLVDTDPVRCAERVESLKALFPAAVVSAHTPEELPALLPLADGLVHCTPVGMAAHPGVPLDTALLEPRHWVADIVYRPLETELVRRARELGCRVLDGGRMAVGQAADAFRLFTGRDADAARMREHFLELIAAEDAAVAGAVAGSAEVGR